MLAHLVVVGYLACKQPYLIIRHLIVLCSQSKLLIELINYLLTICGEGV
jgi:hypothetical protein